MGYVQRYSQILALGLSHWICPSAWTLGEFYWSDENALGLVRCLREGEEATSLSPESFAAPEALQ